MADELLGVEARLENFISKELGVIKEDLKKFGRAAKKQGDKAGKSMSGFKKAVLQAKQGFKSFLTTFGPAAVVTGLFTAAIFKLRAALQFVVDVTETFEQTMSRLKAITKPTTNEFKKLTEAAKELGETTVFTASQVGDAFTEMGKLGLKTNQIIAASAGVLDLAAASQVSMAQAAEVTIGVLKSFRLPASESSRAADVIAKSFTESGLEIGIFAEAMTKTGTVAGNTNVSLEETIGALGVLADLMIKGSLAGTGMKRIMLELADGTSEASRTINKINPQAETFIEKLKALKKAQLGATATTRLFGLLSTTAAQVLIENADTVEEMTNKVTDSTGSLKEMASVMLDNVRGASKLLTSAQETLGIAIGEAFGADKKARIEFYTKAIKEATQFVKDHKTDLKVLSLVISTTLKILLGFAGGIAKVFIGVFSTVKTVIATAGLVIVGTFKKINDGLNWLSEKFLKRKIIDNTVLTDLMNAFKDVVIESANQATNALLGIKFLDELKIEVDKAKEVIETLNSPGGGDDDVTIDSDAERKLKLDKAIEFQEKIIAAQKLFRETLIANASNDFERRKLQQSEDQAELLAQARRFHEDGALSEQQFQQTQTNIEQAGAKERKDIARDEMQFKVGTIRTALGGLSSIFAQAATKNKSLAAAARALAVGEATVSTFLAANKALASGPPPFNFIAMASVIAAGIGNVAKISSKSFEKGTDFAPGGLAQLHRDEMVQLPRGAQVFTRQETKNMITNTTNNNRPTVVVINAGQENVVAAIERATRDRSLDWNRIFAQAAVTL